MQSGNRVRVPSIGSDDCGIGAFLNQISDNSVRAGAGRSESETACIGHNACVETLRNIKIHRFFVMIFLDEMINHLASRRDCSIRIHIIEVFRHLMVVDQYFLGLRFGYPIAQNSDSGW